MANRLSANRFTPNNFPEIESGGKAYDYFIEWLFCHSIEAGACLYLL